MEQIKPDLKLLQQETSRATSNISGAYRTIVGKLILKTRLAYSLPSLDTQEFPAAVEAWCEILFGSVPPERLNDCYIHAVKTRASTFPLAVTEILTAWRAIAVEEAEQAKRQRHCHVCQGRRFEMVYNPATDTEVEKECPYCFGEIRTDVARVN